MLDITYLMGYTILNMQEIKILNLLTNLEDRLKKVIVAKGIH